MTEKARSLQRVTDFRTFTVSAINYGFDTQESLKDASIGLWLTSCGRLPFLEVYIVEVLDGLNALIDGTKKSASSFNRLLGYGKRDPVVIAITRS